MMVMMMEGDEFERRSNGLVQAVIDMYGAKMVGGGRAGSVKNAHMDLSEKRSSRATKLHWARKNMNGIDETRRASETIKAKAKMELLEAKKTVKDLAFKIEESNLKTRHKVQVLDAEKKGRDRWAMEGSRMESDHRYTEVIRELESAKQELSKLQHNVAEAIGEKSRAEKEMSAAIARTQSCSGLLRDLSKEVEEANEEHVLVELAMMEATKELAEIEAQRKQEHRNFSVSMEDKRKQMNILRAGIQHVGELEIALEATNSEMEVVQNKLNFIKEKEKISDTTTSNASDEGNETSIELNAVLGELKARKTELELLKQEGLQSMISVDAAMNELELTVEEISRVKSQESKQEKVFEKLNSRLQMMYDKLDAAKASEATTTGILSTMSTGLDQLRTSAGTAKRERELMVAETLCIKSDVKELEFQTNLFEEKENDVIDELQQAIKSEAASMEKLKVLTKSATRARALAAKTNSMITISKFEYEYLSGCAAVAREVADKKIEAAEACIKALKKSEEEMLMEIGKAQREVRELSLKEEPEIQIAESSLTMRESMDQQLKQSKSVELTTKMELSKKSITDDGSFTPSLSKHQRPASRSSRLSSFTIGRRKKVMVN
ncbi:PLASTID MOVEMENT IMPAIRED 2-like protein [Drosera capensis]